MPFVISNTGEKIQFDETFSNWAKLISEMLEEGPEEEGIPLPFDTDTIKLCIEICKNIEPIDTFYPCTKWRTELLNISPDKIFELMKLANFINIEILINMTCMKIINMIKGKSPEVIRSIIKDQGFYDYFHSCYSISDYDTNFRLLSME